MYVMDMLFIFVVIIIKKPTDYISEFSQLRNLTKISIHQKRIEEKVKDSEKVKLLSEVEEDLSTCEKSSYVIEKNQTFDKSMELSFMGSRDDIMYSIDNVDQVVAKPSFGAESKSSYMDSSRHKSQEQNMDDPSSRDKGSV